jgi:tripartite-type tricarboxylate transporter receptor subunit TctC
MTLLARTSGLLCAAAMFAAAACTVAPAQAEPAPVSFAGKQIRVSIGFSPTGFGYDTYGRLLARHMGKYLPGNPAIVPQNRPGAGSLNLANYLFNAAPKDGTEIALVGRGVAMEPLLGGSGSQAKFDSTKFAWIGSMNNEVSGFFIRQPGPVKTLAEAMKGAGIQVGSTGIGGDQHAFAAALNALIGTRLKPIAGYPGTQEIMLAVERGELDGIVGYSWGVAKSGNKAQLDNGALKIILQLALAKHKELPDVPLVTDFVKNPEDRQVLEMIFSRQSMGRPVVAPPGVDPRVVEALRKALADTMRDPQFVAEGAKIGLELDFVSGTDVQSLVERLYRSPRQVVSRAQAIFQAN